jgi:hypothetical protein
MAYEGFTLGLYGDTGSGKTAQIGELAKHVRKSRGKNLLLHSSDMGGFDTIKPLVRAGVVTVNQFKPESDDPWIYVNDAVTGAGLTDDIGAVAFDGGTSLSQALLTACSHSTFQIGQQRTQTFKVTGTAGKNLNVSINNEAHYGVVQGFMLDAIWKSTWLTRRGIDVLWTFLVHRGEEQDRTPILGPKLAGKALTAQVPTWFRYFFRIDSIPQAEGAPRHVLYTSEHSELAGLGHSFGNARQPLDAEALPSEIEPASITRALELVQEGQDSADEKLRVELGLG